MTTDPANTPPKDKANSSTRVGKPRALDRFLAWIQGGKIFPWGTGNPTFYLTVTFLVAVVGVFAASRVGDTAVAILVALAAFMGGGLLGFLFAVPRYPAESIVALDSATGETDFRYRGNTNLEQISDWLTKIIVGIGLTQFPQISRTVHEASINVGASLTGAVTNTSTIVGGALLILSSLSGFIFFYLWARVYLPRLFKVAEHG